MNRPDLPGGRLVVRMPNWLGDVVMALPALTAVRQAYPEGHLALAAIPSIAPLFREGLAASPQQVIAVEKTTEASQLKEGRFGAAILLTNSFRTAWAARRSAIPERWGYAASGRRLLLTRPVKRPRRVHQSEYYLALMRALGIDAPALEPRIYVSDASRARAARLLGEHVQPGQPIVGFAPGAAYGHAKRWPPERVAEVVARLTRERGAACVLVGAGGDREAGRAIESSLPPDVRAVNLIGRTDLGQLVGVLAACRVFVSNDSGAMHLAAAVGVPVTAIFGPTNERATAPIGDHDVILRQVFCRPCMLRECPIDHRCMRRIEAADVYAAVARRLDNPA